jgi:hypothetical protein
VKRQHSMPSQSRAASALVALGLSVLLTLGPLVQPAAAQTVPITVTQGETITVTPSPVGNTLVLPNSGPNIQISSCAGPTRIFQGCPIDAAAEYRLEASAIDRVLALNHLPASERARVLQWARSEVRAMLFNELIESYKQTPSRRSPDDAAFVTAVTNAVRLKRVNAATVALDEYNKWAGNACGYTPPKGFTYDRGTACARGANQLFGGPDPPARADFQAYGAAAAYGRYASDDSLRQVSGDTAKAYGTLAGLGATAAATAVAGVVGASLSIGTLTAIQPFLVSTIIVSQYGLSVLGSSGAALAAKASAAASASSAGVSGALSVAGPVAIILTAIVIGVVQGVNVGKAAEIPGQLQGDFTAARSYDPTSDLTRSVPTATQEVYGAFLDMTLPDYPGTDTVPARQSSDPKLVIAGAPNAPMQYLDWNKSRHIARLSGAWWVDTNAAGKSRLTLSIDYLDHAGQGWTATRRGTEFTLRRAGNSEVASDRTTEVLVYQDWQQQPQTVSLPLASASSGPSRTTAGAAIGAVRPTGPYVIVDPSSQALAPRTTTTLEVIAAAGTGLLSDWSVDITYDPTVVQVTECALGAPGVCSPHFGAHMVRIDGGTSTPRAGPTTLARITFRAVGGHGAKSQVGVIALSLTNANGASLMPKIGPGQIEVE